MTLIVAQPYRFVSRVIATSVVAVSMGAGSQNNSIANPSISAKIGKTSYVANPSELPITCLGATATSNGTNGYGYIPCFASEASTILALISGMYSSSGVTQIKGPTAVNGVQKSFRLSVSGLTATFSII